MAKNLSSNKRITQIQATPPGWFVLYLGYEQEPDPTELYAEGFEGYFVVPVAGWALWEDKETGQQGISPFMAEGQLADPKNDNSIVKIVYRPDWLNIRLNGAENITEGSPFGIHKNRLEVEVKRSVYNKHLE